MSTAARKRIVELDVLRGFAALAVVLFHFTHRYDVVYGHTGAPLVSMPYGHFGVQFFFGLSGFVIFMTLERTARPMDFIVSRASRLYPAYWAAVLLTTAAVYLGGMEEFQYPASVIVANLTMLQNLFHIKNVDGVYWTLLVELCFYTNMLLLFMAGKLNRIEGILLAWICLKWLWWLIPALSYLAGSVLIQQHIPFFALGICAYRVYSGEQKILNVVPVVAFALATISVIDGAAHFVVGVLVALTFLGFARNGLGWLGTPVLAWLGGISYTLYLLHENIGWTTIRALERAGVEANLAIAIALATSLGLAALVSLSVERPAMRWMRTRYRARWQPKRSLTAGAPP